MKRMKGCLPSTDSSAQIRELSVSLHTAILPEMPMVRIATKTLIRRISKKVHPDKYQCAGPRLFYIALASNTLIQQCMQSIENKDIQDQRAMPRTSKFE